MSKQKTMKSFMKEQQTLNGVAEILKYVFENDDSFNDDEEFAELTNRTINLLKITTKCEDELSKDKEFNRLLRTIGVDEKTTTKDLTNLILHATIGKQSMVIDRLVSIIKDLEQGRI